MTGNPYGAMPDRATSRLMAAALATILAFGAAGCGGSWHGVSPPELEGNGIESSAGATVLTAEELHAATGSVLRALVGKVPNMNVRFVGGERCPSIALRRARDINGYNFPLVYLDGTRSNSTCILETLPAAELDRVEIYPQGFTTRPGYSTSSHGLILLFSRTA